MSNQLFENEFSVNLMIWEINPSKRKKNSLVNFIIDSGEKVNVGDVVVGNYSPEQVSCYKIKEIKSRRKSALKDKDYLVVDTSWSGSKLPFRDFDLKGVSTRFRKMYSV